MYLSLEDLESLTQSTGDFDVVELSVSAQHAELEQDVEKISAQLEGVTVEEAIAKLEATLDEMKDHYKKGGLGDVKCKKVLLEVIYELLSPFREKCRAQDCYIINFVYNC